ncbi:flagellar hook-basal body complex protein FliE [Rickettsia endosymbiont of Cardiosporidium cionae]|uniref:flagellar hook-basal body complex protein FliE n=1 Tax=Rickettsia endosymbiont of Cardiosporidium cionae TaxID=2777155 RepID=UPI001894F0C8|nr:flagellar hook-basal body complex protein FliE [Rickettsia endosymbiont of Cardiosporidium cionae]KAF8818612.1 hypothetical protein IHI24_000331 [Rickettsia endosymbiont of Cardiosporidium cionae]
MDIQLIPSSCNYFQNVNNMYSTYFQNLNNLCHVYSHDPVKFHNMVNAEFNKINNSKIPTSTVTSSLHCTHDIASNNDHNILGDLKRILQSQEQAAASLSNENTSVIDVMTTANEATHTLKTVVEIKNKLVDSLDKVMNMSI